MNHVQPFIYQPHTCRVTVQNGIVVHFFFVEPQKIASNVTMTLAFKHTYSECWKGLYRVEIRTKNFRFMSPDWQQIMWNGVKLFFLLLPIALDRKLAVAPAVLFFGAVRFRLATATTARGINKLHSHSPVAEELDPGALFLRCAMLLRRHVARNSSVLKKRNIF